MPERKYKFSWKLLGDLSRGRPNLGPDTRLEVYRLMQYSFRDVLEQHLGTDATDRIFFEAGKLAGAEFYRNLFSDIKDFNIFLKKLQGLLREMRIGILRIEEADPEGGTLTLTISEDLDCSGLPEEGYEHCVYDEGFLAGLLEEVTGTPFDVKEIDCWCTGDRTCRFRAEIVK